MGYLVAPEDYVTAQKCKTQVQELEHSLKELKQGVVKVKHVTPMSASDQTKSIHKFPRYLQSNSGDTLQTQPSHCRHLHIGMFAIHVLQHVSRTTKCVASLLVTPMVRFGRK